MLFISPDITLQGDVLFFGTKRVYTGEPVQIETYAVMHNKYLIRGIGFKPIRLNIMSGGYFWLDSFIVDHGIFKAYHHSAFYNDFSNIEYIFNAASKGIAWRILEDRM